MFFCAIVSAFIATHGYEQGRIYFVVTCPNINSVHTRNQFAVVPYHFLNFQILEDGQHDMLDLPLKSPCCSGGKSVNNCINATVSDRWICSIITHSRRFSSIEALSAVVQCECYCLIIFFLKGIGVPSATLVTPGYPLTKWSCF